MGNIAFEHKIKYQDSWGLMYLNTSFTLTGITAAWTDVAALGNVWIPAHVMAGVSVTSQTTGIISLDRAPHNWKVFGALNIKTQEDGFATWEFGLAVNGNPPLSETHAKQNTAPNTQEKEITSHTNLALANKWTWIKWQVRRLGGTETSLNIENGWIHVQAD